MGLYSCVQLCVGYSSVFYSNVKKCLCVSYLLLTILKYVPITSVFLGIMYYLSSVYF